MLTSTFGNFPPAPFDAHAAQPVQLVLVAAPAAVPLLPLPETCIRWARGAGGLPFRPLQLKMQTFGGMLSRYVGKLRATDICDRCRLNINPCKHTGA